MIGKMNTRDWIIDYIYNLADENDCIVVGKRYSPNIAISVGDMEYRIPYYTDDEWSDMDYEEAYNDCY